jgi:predicted nucleotidyltransferase
MSREHILATLRAHEAELRAAGVVHLSVFGSVARGEATDASDVDLMAEFDPAKQQTLFTLGGLQYQLSEWLGTEVDLAVAKWMREQIRERAEREAVVAF